MTTIEWILSSKNSSVPIINGYLFRLNVKKSHTSYWRCNYCPATAITHDGQVRKMGEHNHPPDDNIIIKMKFMNAAKERIESSPSKPLAQIYNEERQAFVLSASNTDQVISAIPNYINIKPTFNKIKRRKFDKQPNHVKDLRLNDRWKQTLDKTRKFLLADDGTNGKILIFATDNFLKYLCQAGVILMDGTFYACPSLFKQIYTIHCQIQEEIFPVVYGLSFPIKVKKLIHVF